MDLRTSFKTLLLVTVSFTFLPAWLSATPYQAQPDQQLSQCVEVAKQGDVKQAFQLAKQTKQQFGDHRMFEVSYINTLVNIVDTKKSRCDIKILNEAIDVVNEARRSKVYDGTGDAEVAYHFMKSLGRLSELSSVWSESVSGKIRIYEGQIAENLKDNPAYPKNALEALGLSMVSEAKAHAFRNEKEATFESLSNAADVGFGEFRELAKEDWLKNLTDEPTLKGWMESLDDRYAVAVDSWSRNVVSQFRGGSFNFSLNNLDDRTVSNFDFGGKVMVVDLWATWCPPCRRGIPHYMKLQQELGSQGVAVVGISMDDPTDPTGVKENVVDFASEQKFNYPILMGDSTIGTQLPGKMALPTTVFIDRSGRVRYVAQGYHDFAKVEAITKILLNEAQTVSSGFSDIISTQNF
jgi:thiol-disulfide isomerase/thioredoxin